MNMPSLYSSSTIDPSDNNSPNRSSNEKPRSLSTIDYAPNSPARYKNSGDSFKFDEHRLKQLHMLDKSLNHSPMNKANYSLDLNTAFSSDRKKQNYFASKGLSMFG